MCEKAGWVGAGECCVVDEQVCARKRGGWGAGECCVSAVVAGFVCHWRTRLAKSGWLVAVVRIPDGGVVVLDGDSERARTGRPVHRGQCVANHGSPFAVAPFHRHGVVRRAVPFSSLPPTSDFWSRRWTRTSWLASSVRFSDFAVLFAVGALSCYCFERQFSPPPLRLVSLM